MRLSRRRDAGFTIIEVLVALTLLAAVILLVTRAFLTVLSVTSRGGRGTVATALGAKPLEGGRTRVEAQPDRTNWRNEFCAIAAQPTTAFAAPYGAYSYRVLLNDQAVSAAPGQEDLVVPCWSGEWTRRGGEAGRRAMAAARGRVVARGDCRGAGDSGDRPGWHLWPGQPVGPLLRRK